MPTPQVRVWPCQICTHRGDEATIADVVPCQQLALLNQLLRHVERCLEHLGVDIRGGISQLEGRAGQHRAGGKSLTAAAACRTAIHKVKDQPEASH